MAEEKHRRRAPGPTTEDGKRKSSQNARTHGCCSKTLIINGESQDEFDELSADWHDEYQPRSKRERWALDDAVRAQWDLRRNTDRYYDFEVELGKKSPLAWTEEEHKQMERYLRYKTAAERSFQRAYSTLEQISKRHARQEQNVTARKEARTEQESEAAFESERSLESDRGLDLEAGSASQEKLPFIHGLEQWVEVTTDEDSRAVTIVEPSNEELLEDLRVMRPAPEMVRRRFFFLDGIPEEYAWCRDPSIDIEQQRITPKEGVQRITIDTWLAAIDRERASGTGHLSDTGPDLPQPNQMSNCPCFCEVCRRNIAIAERWKTGG